MTVDQHPLVSYCEQLQANLVVTYLTTCERPNKWCAEVEDMAALEFGNTPIEAMDAVYAYLTKDRR